VPLVLERIISGGQTGVDQVGLIVARELGYATGGTAPLGWKTEAGAAPWLAEYGLVESWSPGYRVRTVQNVIDADQTVWFGVTDSPGAHLTLTTARVQGKPILINPNAATLRALLETSYVVKVLNIAGNRLRTHPEASVQARTVLAEALKR
jgi:hypothetical protein